MRSRAHYQSHPIHPALIPFPFAFLTGALIFDAIGVIRGAPAFWTTGGHLEVAGIAAGLLAAIPGLIDYVYTVPPASSAKTRATRHALGNVSALVLFAAAWLTRGAGWQPGVLTLVLEFVGAGVLAYSGYLGGTLVSRNLISVDHRYANAGKWQEADDHRWTRQAPRCRTRGRSENRADETPAHQRSPRRAGANRPRGTPRSTIAVATAAARSPVACSSTKRCIASGTGRNSTARPAPSGAVPRRPRSACTR